MKVLDAMGMEDIDDLGMEGAGEGVAEAIGFRFGTFARDTGVMGSGFCLVAAVVISTVEMLRPRERPVPIVETDETGEIERKSSWYCMSSDGRYS
jgi:hypothetical protein